MASDTEQRLPPQLELDDPGLTWRVEGPELVVERRPTLRGSVAYVFYVGIPAALTAWTAADRDWLLAALFGLFTFLMLFALAFMFTMRVTLRVSASGVTWERRGVRAGEGRWPRTAISGVRVRRWEKPLGKPWHRLVGAEMRVRGAWVAIATGRHEKKAVALAEALARAVGVTSEVVDPPDRAE